MNKHFLDNYKSDFIVLDFCLSVFIVFILPLFQGDSKTKKT